MTLRRLFTINAFIASCFGVSCIAAPSQLCQLYGLSLNPAGIWVAQLLGGSLLGFASLMWFGRRSVSFETRRAIALALVMQDFVGLLASVSIQLGGQMSVIGWSNVGLYGVLAAAYTYILVLAPERI
jgi:hypothetical protein